MQSFSGHVQRASAALLLFVSAMAAQAAATADEITRQALLRGHTTAEAQRRYDELRTSGATASTAPAQAAAAGLGALAANIQRRQGEQNAAEERMWMYLERGLDVPLETKGVAETLDKLLRRNAEPDERRMGMKILKDASVLPPAVELMRDIEGLRLTLVDAPSAKATRAGQQRLNGMRHALALRLEKLRIADLIGTARALMPPQRGAATIPPGLRIRRGAHLQETTP